MGTVTMKRYTFTAPPIVTELVIVLATIIPGILYECYRPHDNHSPPFASGEIRAHRNSQLFDIMRMSPDKFDATINPKGRKIDE
jgi:hypothetical protein